MAQQGWILGRNLAPFLSVLGSVSECRVDEDDMLAFEVGVKGTDDERGIWFDYELAGERPVKVSVARCVGGDELMVRITNAEISASVDVLLLVAQSYLMMPYGTTT